LSKKDIMDYSKKIKDYCEDYGRIDLDLVIEYIITDTKMLTSKELLQVPSLDEISLSWLDEELEEDMDTFITEYTNKLFDRVIKVIESFEDEI
jgi:Mg2+ and Co2+ transporter CorA